MRLERLMELGKQHSKCPQCGSSKIGGGSGMIYVDDTTFRRTCKCGWKVEVKEEGGSKTHANISS
ncbi:DUF3797 domain-containing protein [Jeotgalibacillus terrae]|uniref:DUF3797 domain-containing protein n=1 Tax=Jeotgalibacillus terrae TaxID=587735 RepID=A0ABW5ZFW0_9BACL|nr:DUF3797 domain-containing protein [Jeotgalibacillus terrae]MBM7580057.1 iron(III) transport system ATP-binding protein [Jeotgalibacillus terrae]